MSDQQTTAPCPVCGQPVVIYHSWSGHESYLAPHSQPKPAGNYAVWEQIKMCSGSNQLLFDATTIDSRYSPWVVVGPQKVRPRGKVIQWQMQRRPPDSSEGESWDNPVLDFLTLHPNGMDGAVPLPPDLTKAAWWAVLSRWLNLTHIQFTARWRTIYGSPEELFPRLCRFEQYDVTSEISLDFTVPIGDVFKLVQRKESPNDDPDLAEQ